MKFRKKPIVVDAEQWWPGKAMAGVHTEEVYATIGGRGHGPQTFRQPDKHYVITKQGQKVRISPGEWIITEPDGIHHYPCKPDVFAAIYEPAE